MSEAARSFVERQLGRESAWRMLEPFSAGLEQHWLPAWVALLGELDESMFERSDPRVAQAKLSWWASDLAAGTSAQHPLTRALLAAPAARAIDTARWRRLGSEALAMSQAESLPGDWEDAAARWGVLAGCVADIESRMFGVDLPVAAVRLQWQRQRLWWAQLRGQPEQGVAPLAWTADSADPATRARGWHAFAEASAAAIRDEAGSALPLHRALLRSQWRWRLAALLRGRPPETLLAPAPLRLLWNSWRAAVKVSRS